MKILHVLNTATFSGAENVAITIINNLSKDFDAAYVSLDGSIRERLNENGIKFYPVKNMTIRNLNKVIKDYNPQVIHAHDFTTSVVAALTLTRTPIISHLHHNAPWLQKPNLYSFMYLISSWRFKKILGVSESIFNEYIFSRLIKNKTKVVSNPINIHEVIYKSEKGTKKYYDIVFLGRLDTPKNPLKFIELINKLVEKIPNLKVAMIGNGKLRDNCIHKIKTLKLDNNIDMLGFMDNPYGILSNSKVLCMTSTWEGFGLVAIEAFALGIPVVAYPVGGLKDIINESNGLLASNDKEYIEEMEKLIHDKKYWNTKSQNSLKRAQEINNINEYMNNLMKIYLD